jgi:hypothetical protein
MWGMWSTVLNQPVLRIDHVADGEGGKPHARLLLAVGWRRRYAVTQGVGQDHEIFIGID